MTRRWITIDTYGVTRSGPFGAWWAWIRPRACNGIGISYETPRWRAWAWNIAFTAGEALGALWVHTLGFTWPEIAAVAARTAAFGTAYIFTVLPFIAFRVCRRYEVQVLVWQAAAVLVEADVVRSHYARHGVDISRAAMLARLTDAPAPERERVAA